MTRDMQQPTDHPTDDARGAPAGGLAPTTGDPLASSDAQLLEDGGSLENGGELWGPPHAPKTDAADNSALEQTGQDPGVDPWRAGPRDLNPTSGEEPYVGSGGRDSSASGS